MATVKDKYAATQQSVSTVEMMYVKVHVGIIIYVCMSKSLEYSFRGNEYFLHTLVDTRVNASVMLCTFQVQEMTFCQWP